MQIWANQGGTWLPATPQVFVQGMLTPVLNAYVRDGGVWHPLFSMPVAVNLTLSNTGLFGSGGASATVQIVTNDTTTVQDLPATGAPFSFQWSRVSGSALITALDPQMQNTGFAATLTTVNQSESATFVCEVSDSSGAVIGTTPTVSINMIAFSST